MATRRRRRSKSLAVQTMELGVAVPQVIAHRIARMAIAGASPSARDRKELRRMGIEKVAAVNEAWNAMALEAFRANQRLTLSFMHAALGIFGKGMAPVRRRAVANAKRLGRSKRR